MSVLARHDLVGSMGRVGVAGDNAAMENFFALLQKNVLDRRAWATRRELRIAIVSWIERIYHRRRRQRRLARLTPSSTRPSSPQPHPWLHKTCCHPTLQQSRFAAIIYMLVSGYAWRAIPPCIEASKSTVHRRFHALRGTPRHPSGPMTARLRSML